MDRTFCFPCNFLRCSTQLAAIAISTPFALSLCYPQASPLPLPPCPRYPLASLFVCVSFPVGRLVCLVSCRWAWLIVRVICVLDCRHCAPWSPCVSTNTPNPDKVLQPHSVPCIPPVPVTVTCIMSNMFVVGRCGLAKKPTVNGQQLKAFKEGTMTWSTAAINIFGGNLVALIWSSPLIEIAPYLR